MTSTGQVLLACMVTNVSTGGSTALAARLNADGALDPTFGSGGVTADTATGDEVFHGVAAESDGTVIEAGTSSGDVVVAAYNTDGSVDMSFGTSGRVTVPIAGASDATAYGVTLDASGNIVVVGSAGGQFLADRFTSSGVQDPTFNGGAPLLFGSASDGDLLSKVAVESTANGGGIVAAGESAGSVVVVQLTSAGALESGFGTGGIVTVPELVAPDTLPGQPDTTEGLALDPAGNIVVANTTAGGEFATARLNPAGSLDKTFGTGGIVTTSFGGDDDADTVAIQPDGSQIIVVGTSTNTTTGTVQEAIAAYTPQGSLDPTFGTGGQELLSTGLSSPTPALARPSGQIAPQAEGLGGVYAEEAFASIGTGKLFIGTAQEGRSTPSASTVLRLVTPAPTSASLPTGTLDATISASLPLGAVVGGAKSKASATVTVTNPTSLTISGRVTVTLLASLGQSLGGATQLVAVPVKLKLKAGAQKALRIKLSSFPTSLPTGSYFLVAAVKAPDGTITGASTATPSLMVTSPFVKISASNLVASPATDAPGGKLTVSLTLLNNSNVQVAGKAPLTLSLSTSSTGAGGSTVATTPMRVKLKALAGGTYKARIVVPAGTVAGSYYVAASLAVSALGDLTAADGMAVSATPINVT